MIMYDGNYGDAPPLTWPQDDPIEVHSIIKRYESIKNEKHPKNFDLNNFFEIRKNMVDNDISKVQKRDPQDQISNLAFKLQQPRCRGAEEFH